MWDPRRSPLPCTPPRECASDSASNCCWALQVGWDGIWTTPASQSFYPTHHMYKHRHALGYKTWKTALMSVASFESASQVECNLMGSSPEEEIFLTFRFCIFPCRDECKPTCWNKDGLWVFFSLAFSALQSACVNRIVHGEQWNVYMKWTKDKTA